jgi:hypothetical protein
VAWALLWLWITRDARLLHRDIDPRAARASARRFTAGLFAYALTVVLSFVSPLFALVVHFVIAGYYVFDQLAQPQAATPDPG